MNRQRENNLSYSMKKLFKKGKIDSIIILLSILLILLLIWLIKGWITGEL